MGDLLHATPPQVFIYRSTIDVEPAALIPLTRVATPTSLQVMTADSGSGAAYPSTALADIMGSIGISQGRLRVLFLPVGGRQ